MAELIVTVEKVAYRNETGWSILLTDKGAAKGVVNFEVMPDDCLKLNGNWAHSDYTGKDEFVFKVALLHIPEDPRTMLTYAVSITHGFGESREDLIWERYGKDWRTQKVLDIPGFTETASFNWEETLRKLDEHAEQVQAISFLMAHGCTINLASVAWETWKADTLGKVNGNPYTLCDMPHYGFVWIDENVRPLFGIDDKDHRRIEAAITYTANLIAETSGTAIDVNIIHANVNTLVPVMLTNFNKALKVLEEEGKIKEVCENVIALSSDYDNEYAIAERWNV